MAKVVNRSARIYHFDGGMCGPGQTVEITDEEFQKSFVQLAMASGDIVEERDQQKLQAIEQKAAEAQQKAQSDVAKTEAQVRTAHEQTAQKAAESQQKAR